MHKLMILALARACIEPGRPIIDYIAHSCAFHSTSEQVSDMRRVVTVSDEPPARAAT